MRDGEATRQRLLTAATEEFVARGIAGARVDRIAAAAKANKAQMYAYFGSKDGLFDAVFRAHNEAIVDTVPLTADDLPGYATRLYDAYLVRPDLVRLAIWSRLERIPSGDLLAELKGHDHGKLATIAQGQEDGHIDPAPDPADVLSLVIAMSLTWSPISVTFTASPDDPAADHDRRRTMLAEAVRRAFAP